MAARQIARSLPSGPMKACLSFITLQRARCHRQRQDATILEARGWKLEARGWRRQKHRDRAESVILRGGWGFALIGYDYTALDDQPGVQQIPVAIQRIAIDDDDVGELADFERPEPIAHLDECGRVGSHHLDEVSRREHEIQRSQFMGQAGFWE